MSRIPEGIIRGILIYVITTALFAFLMCNIFFPEEGLAHFIAWVFAISISFLIGAIIIHLTKKGVETLCIIICSLSVLSLIILTRFIL